MGFLIFLAWWCGSGLFFSLLHLFVYFRGPKHLIDMYCSSENKHIKEMGKYLRNVVKEDYALITRSMLIIGTIIGPISIVALYKDFKIFGF